MSEIKKAPPIRSANQQDKGTENKIIHDGSFDLATAKTSKAAKWKNSQWQWGDFLEIIRETHRTHETYNEYVAATKSRQGELKDVGGFLGGYLSNGRRKAGNVLHRQLISLDLDFASVGFWDDFTMTYLCAAAMYSTHKHSPEKPRFRLIIPLSRPVFADEYQAIARKVAGNLGIELFDPTTFQPERLMYWPSTSKDGVYEFKYQDGTWLDADEVLASYTNWKDSSEWPLSTKVESILQRSMQKQGDPLEKPGVIGAFCRTFTIPEVIEEFLSDRYESCSGSSEGRYTYKEGSTAAGLVVYDDKFAYSHHGTDPTSGKLCNAFDLVRIHKFGLKDEGAREGTPHNKMPSYLAMIDFAANDPRVKKLIISEKMQGAKDDFADLGEDPDLPSQDEENDEWKEKLDVDRKGNVYNTIDNVCLVLTHDRYFKGRIAYDDFEKCEVAIKDLPWRKVTQETRRLVDQDDANMRHYLEKTYGITSAGKIKDASDVVLNRNSFHPVKDYLNSVTWDGENRLDTLFIDYLGAVDTPYTRAVTRKAFVAAIQRVFKPGCKFDTIITLIGKQGVGKSTILNKLGKQWFSDTFVAVKGRESFEQLQGVWIMEISELAGLKKADLESIKGYVASQVDTYRVAYGKRTERFPRQCIFFATTNNRDFLRDPTGNRRFWPIDVWEIAPIKNVMKDLTDVEVDQIWAEAMMHYKKGEKVYLNPELENAAREIQEGHREHDDRTGLIQNYLDTLIPENWDSMDVYERRGYLQDEGLQKDGITRQDKICAAQIFCEVLGGTQKDMNPHNTRFIHDIMRNMPGWSEYKSRTSFKGYGNQRGYYRRHTTTAFGAENTTVREKVGTSLTTELLP